MSLVPAQPRSSWARIEKLFFLRRAYFLGEARRSDYIDAFDAHPKTATRRLQDASAMTFLDKKGKRQHFLEAFKPGVLRLTAHAYQAPMVSDLNDHLSQVVASGIDDPLFFCMTGVRTRELNLHRTPWINPLPSKPHVLGHVVRELAKPVGLLDIDYVSLSRGKSATRLVVIPRSLQAIGEQLSLYAYCLWKGTCPSDPKAQDLLHLRPMSGKERHLCLVLSRIVDARTVPPKAHATFKVNQYRRSMPPDKEETVTYDVVWNPDLTPDQRRVLERELHVSHAASHQDGRWQGRMTHLNSRAFQFQRLFCDLPPQGVWPPLFLLNAPSNDQVMLPIEKNAFEEPHIQPNPGGAHD